MKLSICMMVKDEETNLERCLTSLNNIVNSIDSEIIIVDTGSKDNTVEIAKKYTDKIYFHLWNNNFSEMRNISIKYAKGEWILIIDADEEVRNSDELVGFLKSKDSDKFNTIIVTVNNIVDMNNRYADTLLKSTRLFRRSLDFKYVGAVHNQPVFKKPIVEVKTVFDHYGYITTDKELMKKKFERTWKLLESELEKEPDNIYNRSQLSVTYGMHGDHEKGLEEILKAYDVLKNKALDETINYIYVYNRLATAYYTNNKFEETEEICKKAVKIDSENIDLYYFLAKSQYLLNKYDDSIKNYSKYFELIYSYYNNTKVTDIIALVYTINRQPEAHFDMFKMYTHLDNMERAIEHIEFVDDIRIIISVYNEVVKCYFKIKKYKELLDYFDRLKISQFDSLEITFLSAIEEEMKLINVDERINLYDKLCCYGNENYSLLNSIRSDYFNKANMDEGKINKLINNIDLNECFDYYGDVFYYLISLKKPIQNLFLKMSESNIEAYFKYIKESYNDLYDKIEEYVSVYEKNQEFKDLKTNKILSRILLSSESLNDDTYLLVFKRYINYGVNYIVNIYNEGFLQNEFIYDVKNDEEIFFLYMYKAEILFKGNELEHIKYLRKALEKVPMMKKGIGLLLNEMKEKESFESIEMKELKIQLKNNIRNFIKSGNIDVAESLIKEYESIVSNDMEIVLFKSEISIERLREKSNSNYKM
ncbi:glycosyl transferase [Clostridium beijerinckii]|uniref:Glycosyltransferase n=1 Tax=Clostridium beijerinckii TaxID=1520 RepID=A0AB74VDH4_CLOBE|nr:glycosyltransferase family 2 protein [Clostridium beijerinckii]NRZ28837.1 glycosyltransferase involved in cell wall biosynthesis [Clostridium beijerinckii]NYB95389.1 glycosyltransferase involved in cell wall biosynthesis [Clostridium beijerinckii]OOM26901.1 SPBc2 prophage-derived glycosyltransferase SunS [Clostridium beijerinckii]QUN34508.1 glycosyltransferase [Clostridium beijerinckii]SQB00533.1 glycosyltransferase [Clostridium beijerinckii]